MFKDQLKERTRYVEKIIYSYLPEEEGYQETIMTAMNYSMKAGGKRLRPMLMLETARMLAGDDFDEEIVHPFMAAIEMIHTYSLIHDDLPALDNDDFRRGRRTCHRVFGEALAILAGDALLNYAYETACKSFAMAGADNEKLRRVSAAMTVLASKPGINGMIGGQVVDVIMTGKVPDIDELNYIYENKTGALIECSMMIGAILAGASDAEIEVIEQTASDVGMAFQIQDDILDVYGDSQVIGKPVLSDEENGKITMLSLMGHEKASAKVKELSESAVSGICRLRSGDYFLKELIMSLVSRDK